MITIPPSSAKKLATASADPEFQAAVYASASAEGVPGAVQASMTVRYVIESEMPSGGPAQAGRWMAR
jgi:hypothetical protein